MVYWQAFAAPDQGDGSGFGGFPEDEWVSYREGRLRSCHWVGKSQGCPVQYWDGLGGKDTVHGEYPPPRAIREGKWFSRT